MCDVIYEDNHLLVAVKPQNIPTQLDSSNDKDFLTMLKDYLKREHNKPGNVYLGLVHRLDRPTGGVMVFAKTSKSAERLSEQIKDKSMKKTYFVVVNGKPKDKRGRLTNYLKKDEKNNTVKIVPRFEEGAKEAILDYELIDTKEGKSLLKINLLTGRSHQIRVQMAGINCSVVNDQKYGDQSSKGNLALYSSQISFVHPTKKNTYVFDVPPPYDEYPWNLFNQSKYNLL